MHTTKNLSKSKQRLIYWITIAPFALGALVYFAAILTDATWLWPAAFGFAMGAAVQLAVIDGVRKGLKDLEAQGDDDGNI